MMSDRQPEFSDPLQRSSIAKLDLWFPHNVDVRKQMGTAESLQTNKPVWRKTEELEKTSHRKTQSRRETAAAAAAVGCRFKHSPRMTLFKNALINGKMVD